MLVEGIYIGVVIYRTQLLITTSLPNNLKLFPYFNFHSSAAFLTAIVILQEGKMLILVALRNEYSMYQMRLNDR